MGDSKLSERLTPSHLPKHLPLIPKQMQASLSITQNMNSVKIQGFSSNLHYCRCLIFLHSRCFWAQETRLLQLVYVIESITLFMSADYRNHPQFSFQHRCSEHPESIEQVIYKNVGWQARASQQLCISYFVQNPVPCGSKEQIEKCFSQADKDQRTFISLRQTQPRCFLFSQSRIFSQLP